jgi:hypothetical protein
LFFHLGFQERHDVARANEADDQLIRQRKRHRGHRLHGPQLDAPVRRDQGPGEALTTLGTPLGRLFNDPRELAKVIEAIGLRGFA